MKAKILIVDDEPEQVRAFVQILEQEGGEVILAEDDLWALYYYDEFRPNLIILDIRFDYDERMGLDILKRIRVQKNDRTTPIIMLTGLADHRLPSESYNKDADHFVGKSESTENLLALVKRCLRRSRPELEVIHDYIEIDWGNKSVKRKMDGEWQRVHLQPKEFDVLEKLVSNACRVITRETLYESFFGDAEDPANALYRCISELRRKLESDRGAPQYVLTKRGVGYKFTDYR
jgi:DNA-binding response OmpR family regulator